MALTPMGRIVTASQLRELAEAYRFLGIEARGTGKSLRLWAKVLTDPAPLCIDGHKYHRRQRRRIKRKR